MKKITLNKIISFILFSFIFYITFSYAVSDTVSRLLLYTFIGATFLGILKMGKVRINAYLVYYFIFFVLSYFTVFYSADPNRATSTSYSIFVVLVILVSFSQYITDTRYIRKAIDMFAMAGLLLTIYIFIFNYRDLGSERLGESLFGNAIRFSYIIIPISIIYMWRFLFTSANRKMLAFNGTLALVTFYLCMMTGGRKAVMIPLMFLCLALFMKYYRRKADTITIFFALIFLGGIFFYFIMNNETVYAIFGRRMELFINFLTGSGDYDSSISTRINMIEKAVDLFKNRPLIGYGMDNFAYYYAQVTGKEVYSHNNFLELLVSGGVLMFIAYYWIYGHIILKLIKIKDESLRDLKIFFIGFLITILVSDFGSISYKLTQNHMILLLAYLFVSFNSHRESVPEVSETVYLGLEDNFAQDADT